MSNQTTPVAEEDVYVSGEIANETCPEGVWPAVCVDVRNGGTETRESKDGGKPYSFDWVYVVWQVFPVAGESIAATQGDGRPFQVDLRFLKTLNPSNKALAPGQHSLREFLETWRGKKFTPEEVARFNLSKLKGASCFLEVGENLYNGKIYASVLSVAPGVDGDGKPIKLEIQPGYVPVDYVARNARRSSNDAPAKMQTAAQPTSAGAKDEYVPF